MTIICKYCNKTYASHSSRSNHIKKYHSENVTLNVTNVTKPVTEIVTKNIQFKCLNCNEKFNNRQSKWRHEKKCKKKENDEKNIDDSEIKKEMLEYKKENLEIKKEMEKIKDMLQQALKVHPKTLNKINKQLNNTNNGIINNNIIVQLGRENLSEILTLKEKSSILNRQVMGINDLVELVHISGKYKKFMNVYITNLQNTIAYRYDEKMNTFIAVNKNELLNDLIDARMYDIEKFFEEIGPNLDSKKADQIRKFIERMNNEEDEMKGIKKDEIKLVLYNNLSKIKTNDISNMIKIEENSIDV
jgi:hypothetical protein